MKILFSVSIIFLLSSVTAFSWTATRFKNPSVDDLKKTLTPLQYKVTQNADTEPPFKNDYWDNKNPGIYVDIISGQPLFSSLDKYDSGTGWPSFTKPIAPGAVVERQDRGLLTIRTEIRSSVSDSHLGHVFDDGPKPLGKRYCMNSASMKFVPVEKLAESGYSEFVSLFAQKAHTEGDSELAIFAGGCFWCMEQPFDKLKGGGVIETRVGYSGGEKDKPTYEEVSSGTTGHRESIEVRFDPKKISYDKLLDVFWENIDPFDGQGQFCDKGIQYTAAIYYSTPGQKTKADVSVERMRQKALLKGDFSVTILPAKPFFPAEDYHQQYYLKNPIRYKFYRFNCGRDKRLNEVWGKSDH